MGDPIPADEQANYETFRECLSEPLLRVLAGPVVEKPKAKKKRHMKRASKSGKRLVEEAPQAEKEKTTEETSTANGQTGAAEDLGEFIDFITSLIFPSLPTDIRTLNHSTFKASPRLQDLYTPPLTQQTSLTLLSTIPPQATDSLESYALLPSPSDALDLHNLLSPVLSAYLSAVTAPPPIWSTTRTSACELCARDWIPLTYHHLIPRSTHERVKKRGWHADEMLNSVAWLCRACHGFVHRLKGNEELAKGFYTVELIKSGGVEGDSEARKKVEDWVAWVGGVRWKSR